LLVTKTVEMPRDEKGGRVQVFIGVQDGDVKVDLGS
jgi:hypothetical protein